jgi:hypothetical protein
MAADVRQGRQGLAAHMGLQGLDEEGHGLVGLFFNVPRMLQMVSQKKIPDRLCVS